MSIEIKTVSNKKSFPAKYLKYLAYGLYIIKQMHPEPEIYKQQAVLHMHLLESVEFIMDEIDTNLGEELEKEFKEIVKGAKSAKSAKPKAKRVKKAKEETITEQIVELANEPTIVRGPLEEKEVAKVQVEKVVKQKKPKVVKVQGTVVEKEVVKEVVVEKEVVKEVVKEVAVKEKVVKQKKPKEVKVQGSVGTLEVPGTVGSKGTLEVGSVGTLVPGTVGSVGTLEVVKKVAKGKGKSKKPEEVVVEPFSEELVEESEK